MLYKKPYRALPPLIGQILTAEIVLVWEGLGALSGWSNFPNCPH
jgi:hypothetical protein